MNRPKALAAVGALALAASLSLACKGDEAAAPQQTAAATPAAGWSLDAPQPVAGAPSPEAVAAALEILREEQRQKDLADREAALAAKEAELAERETRVARAASAPRPTAVRRTSSAAARPAAPAPAPAPAPRRDYDEPAPVRRSTSVTVPAGTSLAASILDGASSADAQVGDPVSARVAEDVWAGGVVAIPAGSILRGSVTDAHGLRRIGGRSRLAVKFDTLELRGGADVPVYATWEAQGRGETRRDAATIAGSTVGGAVLGRVIKSRDRDRNTAIGAAAGAAVGTVIAARTRGEEVALGAGATVDLTLSDSVRVVVND